MGGIKVLQAPRGQGVGRGYPLPTEGRVWGGAVPRKFFVFFVENTIF